MPSRRLYETTILQSRRRNEGIVLLGQNNKGVCVVKKSKGEEWKTRLNTLAEHITYWTEHRTDKTLEIIQLFYDRE